MKLRWKCSTLASQKVVDDFCAEVENVTIARILRTPGPEGETCWTVHFYIGDVATDSCPTRGHALNWVKEKFARFLATEQSKTDPQEWPQDQMSVQLRSLRKLDLSAYEAMTDDLRNGRLRRVDRHQ